MTDREHWMTCNDPAWMLDALGDQADDRRCEIIVRQMRKLHNEKYPSGPRAWNDSPKSWFEILPTWDESPVCDIVRCLWPSPFIERERVECPKCECEEGQHQNSHDKPICPNCKDKGYTLAPIIDPRWRTSLVMDLARQVRGGEIIITGKDMAWVTSPSPELMLILADAIEEAGCDVPEIGEHLRCGVHVAGECWVIAGILK